MAHLYHSVYIHTYTRTHIHTPTHTRLHTCVLGMAVELSDSVHGRRELEVHGVLGLDLNAVIRLRTVRW